MEQVENENFKGGGNVEASKQSSTVSTKQSLFKSIIGMMINPAGALKAAVGSTKWYFSLLVSALAFGLFFLQTGLDLYKTGQKGMEFVYFSAGIGVVYGAIVVPIVGIVAWGILKMAKTDKTMQWAISSFCLSYSGALVYGLMGIAFSLFLTWKTSVAFGVTGVLWAIGPMIVASREMTGGNNKISILVATLFSIVILFSWSMFGQL